MAPISVVSAAISDSDRNLAIGDLMPLAVHGDGGETLGAGALGDFGQLVDLAPGVIGRNPARRSP